MPLVNYTSSDDSSDGDDLEAPTTTTTTTAARTATNSRKSPSSTSDRQGSEVAVAGRQAFSSSLTASSTSPSSHAALPPLPTRFHNLYATASRVSTRDDPSLHGGRARATPHIQGNWPTHLYIEWHPSVVEHDILNELIADLQAKASQFDSLNDHRSENAVHSFLTSDLGAPLPLHISLSRPIGFATEIKDQFVAQLTTTIERCRIRPFTLSISSLAWVSNYEKTRWFLVLRLHKPAHDELNVLLRLCNNTVMQYGQPPLYSGADHPVGARNVDVMVDGGNGSLPATDVSDAFHVSIAWSLNAPTHDIEAATRALGESRRFKKEVEAFQVRVEEVKAKVGNIVTNIGLPTKTGLPVSLFGF